MSLRNFYRDFRFSSAILEPLNRDCQKANFENTDFTCGSIRLVARATLYGAWSARRIPRPAIIGDRSARVRPRKTGPIARGLAHPARPRRRVDHAVRQIVRLKPPGGVADRFHLGVRGRVAIDDDPARRLADDAAVPDHDGAERLVAAVDRALAHFHRAGHELGCIRRGRLADGVVVGRDGGR